jgi:putative MATE family efflux protein
MSEFLMYLSDSAMVGHISARHLAAMALAVMVAEILWIIVWPLAPATQALAARRFGSAQKIKNKQEYKIEMKALGGILNNALVFGLAAGGCAVILAATCKTILGFMVDDPELVSLVDTYICTLRWVMPVAGIFYALYGFLAAVNLTRPIMNATIGLNILNIIFNYMLIFGKWGVPCLGIQGAAVGTLLAEFLGTFYLVLFVLMSRQMRPYQCLVIRRISLRVQMALAKTALPVMGQLVFVFGAYLCYETLIAGINTVYLAATHIVFTTLLLKRTLVGGFAEGASILVGNRLGQNKERDAVRYAMASARIGVVLGLFMFIAILAFPEKICAVFTHEQRTILAGAAALRFFAVFMFFDVLGYCFETIFTHNGWGSYVFVSGASTHIFILVGLTFILVKIMGCGIYAAWAALALQIVCNMMILTAGFISKKWLKTQPAVSLTP